MANAYEKAREEAQAHFLNGTAEHQMTIVKDDGFHRHLKFRGKSFTYWFDIVTWPGVLVIHGDMHTWVFSRIDDMFEFFRGDRINPGYWAEKLQAGRRECEGFDEGIFKKILLERLDEENLSEADKERLHEEFEQEVYGDSREEWYQSATDFAFTPTDGSSTITFSDVWEIDANVHTIHFLWCCYAIQWGIKQYDAAIAKAEGGEG